MAKLKHCLILALAAVFSMAGLLTLLTSPALAAPPMSNDACLNKALRIRDRAIDDANDSDQSLRRTASGVVCPNLCDDPDGGMTESITSELFKRQPGNTPEPLITAYISPYPSPFPPEDPLEPFDLAYSASFPFGQVAYFCNVDLVDDDDITSEMEEVNGFTKAFVAVGSASTGADPCSILQKLCGPATPSP